MSSATFLDEKDRWIAGEAGIAVFADRLILEARPPIDDETLEAVAARCAGPVPRLRMLAAQAGHAADRSGDQRLRDRATVLRELADMITAGAGS